MLLVAFEKKSSRFLYHSVHRLGGQQPAGPAWHLIDIGCCRYAFMEYVQHELDVIRTFWNTHRIRHNRQQPSHGGVPDKLFFLPANSDATNCGTALRAECLAACQDFVTPPPSVSGRPQLDEYLASIMAQLGLQKSWQWEDCVALYLRLRHIAQLGLQKSWQWEDCVALYLRLRHIAHHGSSWMWQAFYCTSAHLVLYPYCAGQKFISPQANCWTV